MPAIRIVCSIFHDGQFWVATVEREVDGVLAVARHVFGAEPGGAELLVWAGYAMAHLAYVEVGSSQAPPKPVNPKRMKRIVAAEQARTGFSEVIRAAMAEQLKTRKAETVHRRADARRDASAEAFARRSQQRKARHRGH